MKRSILALALLGFLAGLAAPTRRAAAEEQHPLRWEGLWGFQDCYYPCHRSDPQGQKYCTCVVA